jgi:hypothetical protein
MSPLLEIQSRQVEVRERFLRAHDCRASVRRVSGSGDILGS